jgi:hypothetical protein
MGPDEEWLTLTSRLDPLQERLDRMGYHHGLHLTMHSPGYDVYYGDNFLFHEVDGERLVEKATEFVESRGKQMERKIHRSLSS